MKIIEIYNTRGLDTLLFLSLLLATSTVFIVRRGARTFKLQRIPRNTTAPAAP